SLQWHLMHAIEHQNFYISLNHPSITTRTGCISFIVLILYIDDSFVLDYLVIGPVFFLINSKPSTLCTLYPPLSLEVPGSKWPSTTELPCLVRSAQLLSLFST